MGVRNLLFKRSSADGTRQLGQEVHPDPNVTLAELMWYPLNLMWAGGMQTDE